MGAYLVRRVLQIVLTLFVFLTIVFFLVNAQPGDISRLYSMDPNLPPETRAQLQELFGVNEPLWKQYLVHLKNTLTGDFGVSFSLYPRTVADVILERLPRTLVLFLTATVVSFYLGFGLGKIIAWRRGGWVEYTSTVGGVTLYTVFTPWFGLMMIWLFAFKAGWLPIGKFLDPVVWQAAQTDSNSVFNLMIATAVILSVIVFGVFLVTRKKRLAMAPLLGTGSIAVAVLAAVGVWLASGVGHLAWDIVKHMILPIATLTLISFAGDHAADPQQHAGGDSRGLRAGGARQGVVRQGGARPARGAERTAAGGDQLCVQRGVRDRRERDHRVDLLLARHGTDAGGGDGERRPAAGGGRLRVRGTVCAAGPPGGRHPVRLP